MGCRVGACSVLLGNIKLVPSMAVTIYTSTSSEWQFLLPQCVGMLSFLIPVCGGCEMISHCGFKWISLSTNELGFLFECLWAILVSYMKCLFIFFVYFSLLLGYFLIKLWSSNILDMNFFVACIFYSVVSFEELKFLIESNLQYIPLWFMLLKNLEYDFFFLSHGHKDNFYIVF